MAEKVKVTKKGIRQKLEKAYVEMKGRSAKERESRANCPCGCKGQCKCGSGK